MTRFYSALLHLYPSSFRSEYGEEMRAMFGRKHAAGTGPIDPLTMFVAVALCSIITMVGSLIPALRAVRVDPARVMRAE